MHAFIRARRATTPAGGIPVFLKKIKKMLGGSSQSRPRPRSVHCCSQQVVRALLRSNKRRLLRTPSMLNVKHKYAEVLSDPAPCSCSNEDIRKAEAIREALRRELLDRVAPQVDPYWTVGAD
jgi:hypothetical protein